MDSNREPEAASSRELLIASYVLGDMESEERAEFKRRVDLDPLLAREVEQWREANNATSAWMESAPPGIERVGELAIPRLKVRSMRPRWRFSMTGRQGVQRAFLVAAIFLIGFWSGRWGSLGDTQPDPQILDSNLEEYVGTSSGAQEDETDRAPEVEIDQNPNAVIQVANAPAASDMNPVLVRTTTDEAGRLIIDTENRTSGLRVRWFVELAGNFDQTTHQF